MVDFPAVWTKAKQKKNCKTPNGAESLSIQIDALQATHVFCFLSHDFFLLDYLIFYIPNQFTIFIVRQLNRIKLIDFNFFLFHHTYTQTPTIGISSSWMYWKLKINGYVTRMEH